jgi:hypothetical protein
MNFLYTNLTYEEMVCEAEYNNNTLAIAISESALAVAREELESEEETESEKIDNGEVISKAGVASVCRFLYTQASWEKEDNRSEWYVDEFHGDFNPAHNHIGVVKSNGGYKAFVKYGPYGEEDLNQYVDTLKQAKILAIELAVTAAGEGLLLQ